MRQVIAGEEAIELREVLRHLSGISLEQLIAFTVNLALQPRQHQLSLKFSPRNRAKGGQGTIAQHHLDRVDMLRRAAVL